MISCKKALLSIHLTLVPACASASGTFAPLGLDHPANAQASELPIQDPSACLWDEQGAAALETEPAASPDTMPGETPAGAYVCPMHAEVTSDQPGRCPKCGMKLKPREKVEAQHEEHPHDG